MRKPINADAIAVISTAAAATSLPTLARGFCWGLTRSNTASIAVFMNSAVHTMLIASNKTAQSLNGRSNRNPKTTTNTEARA